MNPKLIFLHGGPGYADYLEGFFAGLFPDDFELLFYSQLQHDSVKIDELLKQLNSKIDGANEDVYLIGHSWGGALATEYLKQTGDSRVKGLVLLSSFLCTEDANVEYKKELAEHGLEAASSEQIFLVPEEYELAGDLMRRLQKTFNLRAFLSLWEGFAATYDARDFIKSIQIPVLNIFGDRDIRVPARRIRAFADLNPKVKNVELQGTAHFPFIRQNHRETIVSSIESFVSSIAT